MRIIAGSARGREISAPKGLETRPVTDIIRESLFNIWQFDVEGADFLDLFSGSGCMGLEALSRGANRAVMVDAGSDQVRVIRANLKKTGLDKCHAEVVRDEIVPDEYTTYFKSAIATGRVHVLEDDEERLRGLRALAEKYNPGQQESAEKEISGALSHVAVIAFEVEELTGKQARELAIREAKASGVE